MGSRHDLSREGVLRELGLLGASGFGVEVALETGSTNDDARAAALVGAPSGTAFFAEVQTKGRGRGGNSWTSPPFENLMFSVLFRPTLEAQRVAPASLVVGAVVARVVERRVASPVGVKWPNDVWVNEKKLAGVLVEARLREQRVESLVVGVGLNVAQTEFPPELAEHATSLALLGAAELDRSRLAAELLEGLASALLDYERDGLAPFLMELTRRDVLRGRRVAVDHVVGRCAGLDESGRLLVDDGAGGLTAVASGSVVLA